MEQYLIRRKRNGQFSKKGKVVKVYKPNYWDTFNYPRASFFVGVILALVIWSIYVAK